MANRIQYPHTESHEADEENIGKHQPVKKNGQMKLVRLCLKTGKHEGNDNRRKHHTQKRYNAHDYGKKREADIGQFASLILALLVIPFGKSRYKR